MYSRMVSRSGENRRSAVDTLRADPYFSGMLSTRFVVLTVLSLSISLSACKDEAKPAPETAPAPAPAAVPTPEPTPTPKPTPAEPTAEQAKALSKELIEKVGGDEVMEELRGKLAGAPRATAEEKAAMPRSTAGGEPSVANICNQIPLMGHCYETASTSVGKGFYSKKAQCFAPHYFFEGEPCPTEGRRGSCVLDGGQQVAHFYREADNEGMCKTFRGSWKSADPLVWPVNAT